MHRTRGQIATDIEALERDVRRLKAWEDDTREALHDTRTYLKRAEHRTMNAKLDLDVLREELRALGD
jgi:hypothetical protein